jgi:hypothetical protein
MTTPRCSLEAGTKQVRRDVENSCIATQWSGRPTAQARCACVALHLWAAAQREP